MLYRAKSSAIVSLPLTFADLLDISTVVLKIEAIVHLHQDLVGDVHFQFVDWSVC